MNPEDLREIEHLIQKRFDRIEEGMGILKSITLDQMTDDSYKAMLDDKWEKWKGSKEIWWDPKEKRHR